MKIADLQEFKKAPASGQLLAYTRQQVIFHTYTSCEVVKDELKDENLLELHMFDDSREYRAIESNSKRCSGAIEWVAEDTLYEDMETYCEETMLENGKGTLTVCNYVTFDEHGMAKISDYRLMMGGKHNE